MHGLLRQTWVGLKVRVRFKIVRQARPGKFRAKNNPNFLKETISKTGTKSATKTAAKTERNNYDYDFQQHNSSSFRSPVFAEVFVPVFVPVFVAVFISGFRKGFPDSVRQPGISHSPMQPRCVPSHRCSPTPPILLNIEIRGAGMRGVMTCPPPLLAHP